MSFRLPTELLFGHGRIGELRRAIPDGIERVLIVSDPQVCEKSGALPVLEDQLRDLNVELFREVEANPTFATAERGGAAARAAGSQLIIGLGGGSPMDAAKGVAVLATNESPLRSIVSGAELAHAPLPVICIPTTAGTGSEVTPYAVFTDSEDRSKRGYSNPSLYPITALIDPELTYSMPRSVAVDTGLDALTHAIEAYLSTEATPDSDRYALRTVDAVVGTLALAIDKNRAAMTAMSYAAMMAGVAIAQAGTVLLHVMGYPLTIFREMSHGRANAVLLPEFIEFMKDRSRVLDRVSRIEAMFAEKGGIRSFVEDLGVPTDLASYGVTRAEIDQFVPKVIVKDDVRITPADVTEHDIRDIYRRSLTPSL